ncbi:hypothetical protein ACE6H2_006371 [Prunus campanulata]
MFPWRENQATAKGALNVVNGHIPKFEEHPLQQEGDPCAEAIDESQPHDRTKTHSRQTPIALRGQMVIDTTQQRRQC